MKKGWELKKIGDICGVLNGGTPDTTVKEFWDGENLWITPKDMGKLTSIYVDDTERKITDAGLKNSSAKILPPNSIVLSSRAPIGHLAINTKPISTNQGCKGIIPSEKIKTLFLFYFLKNSVQLLNDLGSGTTFKELSGSKLSEVEIPVPSLPEQEHIISIVVEAFAVIDQAKQNVQRNLQNAKELFQSELNSLALAKEKLGNIVNIVTGKLNANEMVEGGKYPFFTCSREVFKIDKFAFDTEAILLAGNNAVGDFNVKHYKGKFNAYQRTYVLTAKDEKKIDYRYLYYQMEKSLISFKKQSVGAATKFLKLPMIQNFEIDCPSLEEQKKIVRQLDKLSIETKNLESIYQKKLDNLEELKKSILQKAFSGELIKKYELSR